MKTRVIHSKFWSDSYMRSLSKDEKFLYMYLMTNEYVNVLHIYELPTDIVVMQTKMTCEDVERIKHKFIADKKIDCIGEWVHLLNADKYANYKGIKNNHAKLRVMVEMNEQTFLYYKSYLEPLLNEIINETDFSNVKDERFFNLLHRVIDRGIQGGMSIPVRNQKPKYKNQITKSVNDEEIDLDELDVALNSGKN